MRNINENKKAVSLMLSYVLLILISFAIGTLIYFWMIRIPITPGDVCPEGVSILIRESSCDVATDEITIKVSNRGRFNVHGLLVRGSDDPEISPIVNLKGNDPKLDSSIEGINRIIDGVGGDDPLEPNEEEDYNFSYSGIFPGEVAKIRIGAMRIQEEEMVICENSFVTVNVDCI